MRSVRMGMMILGSRPTGMLCASSSSSASCSSSSPTGRHVSTAVAIWNRQSIRRLDENRASWTARLLSNDWRELRCGGDVDLDRRSVAVRASQVGDAETTSLESPPQAPRAPDRREVYRLEFDGASKGNPGRAGAGALLRRPDGSVDCEVMECLGTATNNQAEYRGLIVGLRAAQQRGVSRLLVQGDSNLVCRQVLGEWTVNSPHLMSLCDEARRKPEGKSTMELSSTGERREIEDIGTGMPVPDKEYQKRARRRRRRGTGRAQRKKAVVSNLCLSSTTLAGETESASDVPETEGSGAAGILGIATPLVASEGWEHERGTHSSSANRSFRTEGYVLQLTFW
ncbi:hypothetical protein CBR_g30818 [Chara braunii]|uniref:RNase H type-1 domain-containing protein n=1 Tax=Chara braunii TaxID=69332 RepID=A0A388JXG1_CHABU|nr:hypothetical protein CBR_g30818 [Chara braunii]|eukprot:GBG62499.1 hypothetical protein CBR_g30818 [Chara braunii]